MKRAVSLYLPTWPTDRLRRQLGRAAPPRDIPMALVQRDSNRQVVTAVDRASASLGLAPGMTATKASAMVAGLQLHDSDPERDRVELLALAHWVYDHHSPIVATDDPDGLCIDMNGAAHLYGGEDLMLTRLVSEIESFGIAARIAIAPTFGAAHAAARFIQQRVSIIDTCEFTSFLRALPVDALRLPTEIVTRLHDLGFDEIGEVIDQPSASLTLRFGLDLSRRIEQAFGHVAEPVVPVVPPEMPQVGRSFAEPIATPEALAFHITGMVERLSAELDRRCLGARRIDLLFHRIDNRCEAIRIGLSKPDRDAKRITRLLLEKLVTIDPGLGVEIMTLSAPWSELQGFEQQATSFGERPPRPIADLVDTLINRLGRDHVYRFAPLESDVPERSMRRVSPVEAIEPTIIPKRPRPVRVLSCPEPIETIALLPDHPPISFVWRGKRRKVRFADGPERIYGEWWRRDAEMEAARDYFRIEDESGERFWVYHSGDGVHAATGSGRWFMHGFFG